MTKKAKGNSSSPRISPRAQKVILPLFIIIGASVVILTIISIIVMPKPQPGAQRGVGADGFQAFVEKDGDLGAKSLVTKEQVVAALGKKAKSVGNAEVGKVFNLNNDRSQSITFPFVRADGVVSSLYVDTKLYENMRSLEQDHIYVATAKAGTINGHPAYYKHAQTIGQEREYHLMVVNGLKAYRFVIAQPFKNITISEIDAVAILKKLAQQARI